jgi:hypothetical protein
MQAKFVAMSAVFELDRGDCDGTGNSSPVIAEFDQVRARNGFTVYGRWNSDEAFAEAFSLYRADPDACRRISPQVFAFFDAGRHLRRRCERRVQRINLAVLGAGPRRLLFEGFGAYRAAHPDWDGSFPTANADLARTLVVLRGASGRGYTTTVQVVQVYELRAGDWTPIEPPAAGSATANYGVVASVHCVADDGETHFVASLQNWYLCAAIG